MMNAPNVPGGESGLMSGTSPTHFSPFHLMPTRVGSHGFPSASAEARLYMNRRFAGQEEAQVWYIPGAGRSAVVAGRGLVADPVVEADRLQVGHHLDGAVLTQA